VSENLVKIVVFRHFLCCMGDIVQYTDPDEIEHVSHCCMPNSAKIESLHMQQLGDVYGFSFTKGCLVCQVLKTRLVKQKVGVCM